MRYGRRWRRRGGSEQRRRQQGETTTRRCIVEALESRRHLSVQPAPWPGFVGPMPEYPDPQSPASLTHGTGPRSELHPGAVTAPGTGSFSFYVTYRDDMAVRVASIDSYDIRVYGPRGYERTASLVSVDSWQDGPARVARYKVAPPGGRWDAADNGLYRVVLRLNQVFDVSNIPANDGIVGEFAVRIPTAGGPTPPLVDHAISVLDFGAVPNDGIDDTDAIQAAIDSLPFGHGVPMGSTPIGGVVAFPAGVFDLTRPLLLRSGITLRGAGHNTVLHNISTDRESSAILLHSPYSHGANLAASVRNLTIYTRWTRGITIDPAMANDVLDFFMSGVRISALGPAIDLRDQAVYHSDFEDVEVYNPGSTALHLGRTGDGYGAVNRIRNFRVTGTARSGFRPETALVYIHSDLYIEGLTLATVGANVLPLYLRGQATLNGLNLQVPASSIPGGYAIHFDQMRYVIMDRMNNIAPNRKLRLTAAQDVQVTHMTSDGTSNVLSHITVIDSKSWLRVGNAAVGRLQIAPPPQAPAPHVRVPPPTNRISATAFGVVPSDGVDDTAALQAAIDSLPVGNGIPGSGQAVGGIVVLPHGIINTSAPIKLPSGVWLVGQDAGGTVIVNPHIGRHQAAIELTSPYTHRRNVGAAIQNLGIGTQQGRGIQADDSVQGDVLDLRIEGVRLTTGGPALDLRTVTVNHAIIDRVVVTEPGSTVIWLGRDDNSSVGNLARGVRIAAAARPEFVPETALFVYHGQTRIEGGSIEEAFVEVLPFYASGSIHSIGLYMEYPIQADNIGFVLDNARNSRFDGLTHVSQYRQLHVINGSDVSFGNLNIDGYTVTLRDTVSVDGTSRLTLDTVTSQFDAGMLDHPRINVRGVYNVRAGAFMETAQAMSGNLVADPNMIDVADNRLANWEILWGDQFGAIDGTWSVETVGGHKRLKLVVHSNPNQRKVTVRVKLDIPASAIDRNGIARWRVDGNGEAFVWTYGYGAQYLGRVIKSQTAMRTPRPIIANDQLWIDLPRAAGTYYIWKVGFVAM